MSAGNVKLSGPFVVNVIGPMRDVLLNFKLQGCNLKAHLYVALPVLIFDISLLPSHPSVQIIGPSGF